MRRLDLEKSRFPFLQNRDLLNGCKDLPILALVLIPNNRVPMYLQASDKFYLQSPELHHLQLEHQQLDPFQRADLITLLVEVVRSLLIANC